MERSGAISVETSQEISSTVVPLQDNAIIEDVGEKDHRHKSRTPLGIRRSLLDYFQSCLTLGRRVPLQSYVGSDRQTTPRYDTVLWNLTFLVVFFSFLCLAARYPTKSVRIAFVVISGIAFIALLASASMDLVKHGRSGAKKAISQACSSLKYQVIADISEILATLH